MQSLEDIKDEKEINRKIKQKRRIRGVLIAINVVLVCLTGFWGVQAIVDAVNSNTKTNLGNVITILGKNESDSLKVYEKFVKQKADILDIATYGKYLITSKSKVSYTMDNYSNKIRLTNLTEANKLGSGTGSMISGSITLGSKIDEQIDLFSLDYGDYIIHDAYGTGATELTKAFHYTGEKYFEETLYSFPNNEGRRSKIVIKGKDSSPALVISVSSIVDLPSSYYDVVIIKSASITDPTVGQKWFENKKLKVKEVSSLQEAYKVNASYAVNIINGDKVYTSNYVKNGENKPNKIEGDIYNELDEDNAIRELGGYIFNAGYGLNGNTSYAEASREIMKVKTSSHIGKYTISIGKDIESPFDEINKIFSF